MTPNLETFRIIYPEFVTIDDTVVQFWIDDAIEFLLESAWGKCYPKAVLSLSAHELSLTQSRQANSAVNAAGLVEVGQSGIISSASEGDLSVSFESKSETAKTADSSIYSQTPYGLQYLSLRRQCLRRGTLTCP